MAHSAVLGIDRRRWTIAAFLLIVLSGTNNDRWVVGTVGGSLIDYPRTSTVSGFPSGSRQATHVGFSWLLDVAGYRNVADLLLAGQKRDKSNLTY
jgi:hypothetical protein